MDSPPSSAGWEPTQHRSRPRRSPAPPGPPRPGPTRPRRPRDSRLRGRIVQGAVAAASVAVLIGSLAVHTKAVEFVAKTTKVNINKNIPARDRQAPTKFNAMNVLLLGIDSRTGLTEAEIRKYHLGHDGLGGSDTMMLVHLSANRDQATIISFPRDLYVTIPEYTRSDGMKVSAVKLKINAAFARGGGVGLDGPALAVYTVEQLTGLHIDHYMSIDVPHLGRMVSALGGVDVCLPKAVNDTMFNGKPGGSGLVLSAGPHRLNDAQAVAYVRMRHVDTGEGDQDFGRIRRQQKFLASMLHKVTSAGTLLNPSKLSNFLNTVAEAVTMDTELASDSRALFTIAQKLQSLDPKHVTFATVPIANDNYSVPGVGLTLLADTKASQGLFDAIREDKPVGSADFTSKPKTLKPSEVTVQVLNGGGTPGVGSRTAAELTAMGFQSAGQPANADRTDYATTTIKYAGAHISDARTLAQAVPGATLVQDDSMTSVQLIIGKNFTGTTPIPTPVTTPTAKPAVTTHSAADDPCSKT